MQTNFTAVFGWNMMEDSCGRMWWANSDGRVFYHENGRIVPWPHNHVIDSLRPKFNFVNGLIVGGCGEEIWLTSNYFGVVHIDRHGNCTVLPKAGRKANIIQIFDWNARIFISIGKDEAVKRAAAPLSHSSFSLPPAPPRAPWPAPPPPRKLPSPEMPRLIAAYTGRF